MLLLVGYFWCSSRHAVNVSSSCVRMIVSEAAAEFKRDPSSGCCLHQFSSAAAVCERGKKKRPLLTGQGCVSCDSQALILWSTVLNETRTGANRGHGFVNSESRVSREWRGRGEILSSVCVRILMCPVQLLLLMPELSIISTPGCTSSFSLFSDCRVRRCN